MDNQIDWRNNERVSVMRKHLAQVSEGMALLDLEEIEKVIMTLGIVRKGGGTVYICGNGGSHTTASHFANDLMKMARIKAVCLGDMSATIFAYGNDDGWVDMFKKPLEDMLGIGDAVIGISCSGKSVNILSALGYAIEQGVIAVGFTGISNESEINRLGLTALVHTLGVPDIRVQEDLHVMACHAIVRTLQEVG